MQHAKSASRDWKNNGQNSGIRIDNEAEITFQLGLILTYPKRGILQLIAQKQSA